MLSKKAKYAINALVYLANQNKGTEPIQINTIAKSEKIPRKFLEAILLNLKNAGILNSKKGKAGGYFLQKSPDEINIADVTRLFDGALALVPCVAHLYYAKCKECKDEATCGIRDVFADVRLETVNILKKATLSDVIKRSSQLAAGQRSTQ